MKKRKIYIICATLIVLIFIVGIILFNYSKKELISIKSEKQLTSFYDSYDYENVNWLKTLIAMPFSFIQKVFVGTHSSLNTYYDTSGADIMLDSSIQESTVTNSNAKTTTTSSATSNDYSTTNIQVENVDEADITKTDGNYIYSISENNVVITSVEDPSNLKVVAEINGGNFIPEDMILYENKLVVFSTEYTTKYKNIYASYNTIVSIYDITDKTKPEKQKQYTLYSKYYTSRCINGEIIVLCSDRMRKEDDNIITYYKENNEKKEIGFDNIKYLRGPKSPYQTIILSVNLNNMEKAKVSEYLFDIENAYVSQNNIYLLNSEYKVEKEQRKEYIKEILKKGFIGFLKIIYGTDNDIENWTTIYKLEIKEDGNLQYKNKVKTSGKTINQFSIDEYEDNLRVALQGNEGSRVVIFNKNLKEIGKTEYLSKGEKMYSTRFLQNKAYMVTYKNTDPLYVIDLSNPTKPNVLGELKIPGYSTYLHPYDENHIIGIGMETEEIINRNNNGKVISTSAVITGMKMALFDVSDVNNPIEISKTIIGDRRTTSAILTNHKALLFSKEKGLLAIPVNKYPSDFEITQDQDTSLEQMEKSYTKYSKEYTAEGYFVYNINLTDGFNLKGIIEHQKSKKNKNTYYGSKLLRGLWINNNIFTISEDMIKVNNLENLTAISELKIR